MSDFFQTGAIATLHRLGHIDLQRLETDLENFSVETPMALVLPCHIREMGTPALNGILSVQTGQPVNVNYLFEGDFNGSSEFFGRPDVVGDPKAGRHFPNAFLNAEAFAVPCTWDAASGSCAPGTQHFGNLGRNAFTGPSFKQFDFSFAKILG